ncbi:hypothetical protein CLLI_22230 [Clostridium liquoris]|uniref:Uncharacterized protein n=1 Tax=Clostridium liquoris TaxID=1289519 RepID=A0A2T0B1M0_9CLOT|nr:hypothetical protein [Clostridium liquoris]PRR77659.1 hypothetical protein CLLI_22230 [Clostridium liquoris]
MIRKLLEDNGITSTDAEFKELMDSVTEYIKLNQIRFGKRTNLYEVLGISLRTINVLRRCS